MPLWRSEEEAREQMLWSLQQADLVKISDNEVSFLWACSPEEGAEKLLREFDVKLAMVTLGAEGCLLRTKNACFRAPAPKVLPAHTIGPCQILGGSVSSPDLDLEKAPDALTRDDLSYIGTYALMAASLSTERSGGIPSIPEKETVLSKL